MALFVLALSLITAAPAPAQTWVAAGPTGGDVRALAADPRDPKLLYLGNADGVLYRSDDGGGRWRRADPGFPRRGMSLDNIVVDAQGGVLVAYWEVAGHGGGVARSGDGGRSFRLLPGIAGQSVRALAAAPSHPETLVAGALSGVFRSDDAGESWRRISPVGDGEIRNVESVAIDPADPTVIYVGTWHLPWKTSDGGKSWHEIHAGMIDDSDVFTVTLDRRSAKTVYATACTGIYKSLDAAARWAKIKGIPASSRRTRAFAQDPERTSTLYAGTTEGFWISDDDSASWRLATAKELVVNAILAQPGQILLGTDGAGVLRSTDAGRSWSAANDGFAGHVVARVLVADGRMIVGVSGDRRHSGVLTAAKPEGPWTKLANGLEGRELLALALAGSEVLAGTDDGVFLSASHCGEWRRLGTLAEGGDPHPRALDVAALDDRTFLVATDRGLLRTSDAGATFQSLRLGLASSVLAVAASATDRGLAVAATPLGVFRSLDGGASWQQVSQALAAGAIHSLGFIPGDARLLFAATQGGLLRSADQGRSWEREAWGLPASDIAGLAFAPDGRTLYASDLANGGLFRSENRGDSWQPLPTAGLVSTRILAVAVDPAAPSRIYAGASSGGLHLLVVSTESSLSAPR
jgi:photosystem II stability/assembly factor-like uncharacterized protein